MKTDPTPYIAAALSGIASTAIHHQLDADGSHRIKAEHVAKRAVDLGVATATAVDALIDKLRSAEEQAPADATPVTAPAAPATAPADATPATSPADATPATAPADATPATTPADAKPAEEPTAAADAKPAKKKG